MSQTANALITSCVKYFHLIVLRLCQHMLMPPTLQSVRQTKLLASNPPVVRKTQTTTRKRRTPKNQRVPQSCTTTDEGWAVSQNHQKGIYCATRILDPEELCTYEDAESSVENKNYNGKERISQLEQELQELKRALQAQLQLGTVLPIPPEITTQPPTQSLYSVSTPNLSSAAELVAIPPPDFNKRATPKESTHSTPHVIPPLPPPPPPVKRASEFKRLSKSTAMPMPQPEPVGQTLSKLFQSGSMPALRKPQGITRSPGGTPVRVKENDNFLANAIKKKFHKATPREKSKGKENSPLVVSYRSSPRVPSDSVVAESEWDLSPIRA